MKKLLALLSAAAVLAALAVPAFGATGIAMKDNFFQPKTKTVSKGTTVRWKNRGFAPHNVVVTKGPRTFRSSLVRRGGSYAKRVTRKGTYSIVCTIHAGMKMTLKVR